MQDNINEPKCTIEFNGTPNKDFINNFYSDMKLLVEYAKGNPFPKHIKLTTTRNNRYENIDLATFFQLKMQLNEDSYLVDSSDKDKYCFQFTHERHGICFTFESVGFYLTIKNHANLT